MGGGGGGADYQEQQEGVGVGDSWCSVRNNTRDLISLRREERLLMNNC